MAQRALGRAARGNGGTDAPSNGLGQDQGAGVIRTLRIGNFKAFADSQQVPLRPLTLIFGPNSAGKSSIIHSLALAHHASLTGELDTQRTEIGGESIDLGGFRQYVHRRDVTKQVEWTI